jgi:hypothetical protein
MSSVTPSRTDASACFKADSAFGSVIKAVELATDISNDPDMYIVCSVGTSFGWQIASTPTSLSLAHRCVTQQAFNWWLKP